MEILRLLLLLPPLLLSRHDGGGDGVDVDEAGSCRSGQYYHYYYFDCGMVPVLELVIVDFVGATVDIRAETGLGYPMLRIRGAPHSPGLAALRSPPLA